MPLKGGFNTATLNTENITGIFKQITGLTDDDFCQQKLISNSKSYVESRIIPRELSTEQTDRCEYAAAVHAVYDYTLEKLLSDRIVISQSGKAVSQYCENSMLEAAYSLKKSVFGSMKDLILDDGFTFETMGGI